jgi:catechol 2,3-dioxygenase-like lactoylglutathione lyase family enzyme
MTPGRGTASGLRHSGMVVLNMERCLGFYRDLLGMEVRSRKEEQGAYLDTVLGLEKCRILVVKLNAGGGSSHLELIQFISPTAGIPVLREVNSPGPTHIALTITGLGELVEDLRAKGIRFLSEPALSPGGKVELVFCRDPEGNLVELVEERS